MLMGLIVYSCFIFWLKEKGCHLRLLFFDSIHFSYVTLVTTPSTYNSRTAIAYTHSTTLA